MTEAKFTPGPWALIWHGNEEYPYPLSVHTKDGEYWVVRDGTFALKEDAHLIAAAPEMYEALVDAQKRLRGAGMLGSGDDPVNAALAKSRGETE